MLKLEVAKINRLLKKLENETPLMCYSFITMLQHFTGACSLLCYHEYGLCNNDTLCPSIFQVHVTQFWGGQEDEAGVGEGLLALASPPAAVNC